MCRSCGEYLAVSRLRRGDDLSQAPAAAAVPLLRLPAAVPKSCPKCGSEYVQFLGTGSEKLEDLLHTVFPKARIGRMDRDTVRGHDDFERMLSAFQAGEIDLLVGTQMIAKGHDVHGVTLVASWAPIPRWAAGFSRRRANLSVADPGRRSRRAR